LCGGSKLPPRMPMRFNPVPSRPSRAA
jgi:hypothetical protein